MLLTLHFYLSFLFFLEIGHLVRTGFTAFFLTDYQTWQDIDVLPIDCFTEVELIHTYCALLK